MRNFQSNSIQDETLHIFSYFADCLPKLKGVQRQNDSTDPQMNELHRVLFSGLSTNEESLAFVVAVLDKITKNILGAVPREIELGALREVCNMGESTLADSFFAKDVPADLRRTAFERILLLFTKVFPIRCENVTTTQASPGGDTWNSTCVAWWDFMPRNGQREDSHLRQTDLQIIELLGAILKVDHLACKQSALLGLGRWYHTCKNETIAMVDKHEPDIPQVLKALATRVVAGQVL